MIVKIKLLIKFDGKTYDNELVNKIKMIPGCQNHHIVYTGNTLKQKGKISYSSTDFVSNICQIISERDMTINEITFNIV
jgi:hypothetical protein